MQNPAGFGNGPSLARTSATEGETEMETFAVQKSRKGAVANLRRKQKFALEILITGPYVWRRDRKSRI